MGFSRRKLIPGNDPYVLCKPACDPLLNKQGVCVEPCCKICPEVCKYVLGFEFINHPPPFLPPHPFPPLILPSEPPKPEIKPEYSSENAQKHLIQMSMIVGSCMIGASLLLCLVFAIMRLYSNRRNPRRRSSPILFSTGEDFLDEDQHGPVLDHPIWYIHTVGLSQALIDSITVCKYRKDEGLIEGTDCSVCLSEFEEDESLRLLPKCSHAFHIPCIDTWLRSHKNCPLCRAPVVCGAASDQMSDSTASGSGSQENIRVEISESVEGFGRGTSEVGGTDDDNVGANLVDGRSVESSKVLPNSILADEGSCEPRAFSDLADNRRVTEDEVQPMRRSVSVDSMSASRIYRAVANVIPEEGSSNSELVLVKNPKLGNVAKPENASSSVSRHWRSSSIGISLQMVPMAMKRPFPSGGKLFSSKHRRTLSSILPL